MTHLFGSPQVPLREQRIRSGQVRSPRLRSIRRLVLEGLEDRLAPAIFFWNGGAGTSDTNWMTSANWAGGVAPSTGADLVFPTGPTQLNANNNFPVGTSFDSVAITGSGYSLGGNALTLQAGLSNSGGTSSVSFPVTLASAQGISNSNGNLTVGSINQNGYQLTLQAGSGTLTVDGQISGTGGLVKGGAGAAVLAVANSFNGTTQVTSGTLTLQDSGALGVGDGTASTATTLTNGATLQLQNSITISNHQLVISTGGGTVMSTGSDVWTGNVTFGDPTAYPATYIEPSYGSTLELDGTISSVGNGYLYFYGSGRTILKGTSSLNASYYDAVYVYSGILEVDGALTVPNEYVYVSGGTLSGTGTITSTYSVTNNQIHIDSNGTIDPGTASGPGTLTLANSLSFYNGNNTVHIDINGAGAGQYDQVKVLGDVSLNSASLSVSLGSGFTPTVGQSFTILNNGSTDPIAGTFSGLTEGSLFVVGSTVFQISYVGGTGNDVVLTVVAGKVWDGASTSSSNWNDPANWQGGVAPVPGDNLIFPSGAAQLTNTNNFGAGMSFGSILVSGAGYTLGGNLAVLNTGLSAVGATTVNLPLQLGAAQGIAETAGGTLTLGGAINLNGHALTLGTGSGVIQVSGSGTLSGSGSLTKAGSGTLTLATADTYTGTTTVTGGTLVLQNAGALGVGDGTAATATALTNGATLQLQNSITISNHQLVISTGGGTVMSTGSDVWTGNMTFGDPTAYPATYIDPSYGSTLELDGTISSVGNGYLEFYGSGRTILKGSSSLNASYYDYVYVEDGTLEVDGSLTVPNRSVYVAYSGTLSGTGTITSTYSATNNQIHIDSNGTIDPGTASGPGTLTLANSLSFYNGNNTVHIDINGASAGQYDQVKVLGDVSLNGASLSVALTFQPMVGQTFTILNNASTDPISGTFNGLAEGSLLQVGNVVFSISYVGGTGNDVVLTVQGYYPPTAVTATGGYSITATEGATSSVQTVATFTDPSPQKLLDYVATINWGDSHTSTATIANGGIVQSGNTFYVESTHAYAEEGTYAVTTSVTHESLVSNVVTSTATVGDAPLTGASTATLTGGVAKGTVATLSGATFTDANSSAPLSDFSVTAVNWGDGSTDTSGLTISGSGGTYAVQGTHVYTAPGNYSVSITVTDDGGQTATITGTTTILAQADLSISASAPSSVVAGDPNGFAYTIVVTNNGPSDNTGGFTVTDVLPAGLTFRSSGSTSGASVSGQTVTFINTTGLVSGGSQTITLDVTLASSASSGSSLQDSASVSSNGTTDPTSSNNTSNTVSTAVTTQADLSISASAPSSAIAGDPTGFNYTIVVTNYGPSDNTGGFTVTDVLPAGLTFQSVGSTSGASASGQTVTFTNATGLASGGTETITLHVTLASSASNGSTLQDSASVSSNGTTDPTNSNNTSNTVSTTVTTQADLSISASGPASAIAGDPNGFNYTIVVTNNGPSDNTGGFTVTDVLPAGLTFQSSGSTSGASASGQTVTFTNASGLASGATETITLHVTLASSASSNSTLQDSASVASIGTLDPTSSNNTSNTVSTMVNTQSDLSVSASGPPSAIAGDPNGFTYTIVVTNNGPSDNTGGFTVTDVLPAGLTFVTGSSTAGASVTGQSVSYTNAVGLVTGGTETFTIHVTLASSAPSGSTLQDSASVASNGTTDPTSSNNTSNTVSTTVQTQADLSVSASGPATVVAGGVNGFVYTLVVTNNGPSDNTGGFTVTDVLPAGLTFQSSGSTPGASATGQTVTFTNTAGLASGGTETITLHVTLASSASNGSTLQNGASVSSNGTTDPTSSNNTSNTVSTFVTTQADLSISASGPASVIAGDPTGFNYSLVVTNNGPSDNTGGFTVTDILPAGLTFQSSGSTSGASATGQTVTFTNTAGLASGGTETITLHVTLVSSASNGSTLLDSASVSSNGTTDPTSSNNTSNTVSTTVNTQADLSVSASGPASAIAGDPSGFNYTLVVTNNGPSDNTGGFTVTDVLPAGLTFVSGSSTAGASVTGQSVSYTNAVGLVSGGTETFTIHVALVSSASYGSTLQNSATVSTNGTTDPTSSNNTSNTVSTTVNTQADLSISASGPSAAVAGDSNGFNYTVVVTNNGPSDNTGGFTVTDVLPAGLTFQTSGSTPGASASGQTVTFTNATGLTSGGSETVTLHVTLASAAVNGSVLQNNASVATGGTVDPNSANNASNTVSTTVQTQADLGVSNVGAPNPVIAGTTLTYTVVVTNYGPSDALNTTLSYPLPANTTLDAPVSVPGGWTETDSVAVGMGGTLTFHTASLASGTSTTFTIIAEVPSSVADGSTLTNTATVHTGTSEPSPDTTHPDTASSMTGVIARADLSVTNAGPSTAIAGDPSGFNYTIVVANNGPSDNTGGFTVTDVLPAGLTFHSAGSTPGTSASGQTVTFTNASGLASGASQTITIHVTLIHSAPDSSLLNDQATVATNGTTDPISSDNTSNAVSTTVLTRADLAVSMSNPSTTLAGTDLTYTVTITNNGPSDAQTVSLSGLSIPANTAFVSYTSAAGWSSTASPAVGATSGSITASIATLSAGASGTFTFKVQVNGFTPGNTPISLTATGNTSTTDSTPNDNNNVATGTSIVTLTGAGLATNLANPSQVNLVGDGNTVAFATVGNQIGVVINGVYDGAFSPNGRIVSYGRGTNDRITVASTITLPATLYGSGGGDTLVAGGGNTVLVGGAGSVTLVSGAGNNILISGGGSAGATKTVNGTAGNNIMIGGSTDWDHNDQALGSLLAEWGRTDLPPSTSYATRVSDLMNGGGLNGSFTLNSTTVHDNGVRDTLIGGGAGQNWYLAHVAGAGVLDIIVGKKSTETTTAD